MRKPVFGVSDLVRHKPGCAVTAQLICVFVFAYAKNRFSHDEAHISIAQQYFSRDCHKVVLVVLDVEEHAEIVV